jgi:hypothetical protein
MKKFKGLKLYSDDGSFTLTKEGIRAYQDAITFLKREKPHAPIEWSE